MKKMVMATVLATAMMVAAVGCGATESGTSESQTAMTTEAGAVTSEVSAAASEASVVASEATSTPASEASVAASTEGKAAACETAVAGEEIPADALTLEGTIDEVKDNMFVVATADGKFYAFNFDENVKATKDDFAQGDSVRVYYTGELSEVDSFTGIVYKVEVL